MKLPLRNHRRVNQKLISMKDHQRKPLVRLICIGLFMVLRVANILRHPALPAALLRLALVGGNMGVLMLLAFLLGMAEFGRLILGWGLALILSSVIGFGAPLILLARLGDGVGLARRDLVLLCLIWPVLACAGLALVLPVLWPGPDWVIVLIAAFMLHLVAALASILRACGSVAGSMALRDGAPMLALGIAGLVWREAGMVLWFAAALLGCLALGIAARLLREGPHGLIARHATTGRINPAFWAVAVLGMAMAQADIVIGGQFLSPEETGIYALIRRLANLVALPMAVASWVSTSGISAAHAAGDRRALQAASDDGGRVAFWPGLMLVALVMLALPVILHLTPDLPVLALMVLLAVMLVQLGFAQGMNVATLTGQENLAAMARLAGLCGYLLAVLALPRLDPLGNAVAYGFGTLICTGLIWWQIKARLGVDTRAAYRMRP
jgi:O-antigen/teichoic acid export membrane protein